MGKIKLDIDQMLMIATKYEHQSKNITELVTRLDQMLSELQLYWEGTSALKFEQNYYELKPSFLRMQDVIIETSKAIRNTANAMHEVDQMIIG